MKLVPYSKTTYLRALFFAPLDGFVEISLQILYLSNQNIDLKEKEGSTEKEYYDESQVKVTCRETS